MPWQARCAAGVGLGTPVRDAGGQLRRAAARPLLAPQQARGPARMWQPRHRGQRCRRQEQCRTKLAALRGWGWAQL
eukprot:6330502-Alexandrium_andersonii.AAC.1